jgi:hypothetical protein
MSMNNPADLAAMKQAKDSGQGRFAGMDEQTSIRDFFGQLGIDVDGPVTQLAQFAKDQVQKGNPLGKMENIAGAIPPGGPDLPPGVPAQPPGAGGAPGIDSLMQ